MFPFGTNKFIYVRYCPLTEICLIYTFLEFTVQLSSHDYSVILTYLYCLSLVRCGLWGLLALLSVRLSVCTHARAYVYELI